VPRFRPPLPCDPTYDEALRHEFNLVSTENAMKIDPEAFLFYNDYGGEGINAKSDAIYDLVAGMLERGVPVHGVGLQMHLVSGQAPPARMAENMARLAELGL
jgi:endo-1,4-beta-xylanase